MAARPLRRLWLRFDHPAIEWWTGPVDVVHGPNFVVPPTRRAAEVVSVHDLTPVRFPELANRDTLAYPSLIRRAVARGAWIHTDSAFVAAEVVEHFDVAPERVVPVLLGLNPLPPDRCGADAAEGRRLAGGGRYVLALGTIEPRKNLPVLVDAFDHLASEDPDLRLVVAGQAGWGAEAFDAAVARCGHRERLVRMGFVGDEARAALLRGASVLAFPSVYEGFGLPPLEAMSAGTPVVCTDAGSLPEIVGDAAEVVGVAGLDGATLAAALARVLNDEARREELVTTGRQNVERFSWERCVEALAALYRRAADADGTC
jgi:glycosyltransferase involved in cell wall biosynthesis